MVFIALHPVRWYSLLCVQMSVDKESTSIKDTHLTAKASTEQAIR